MRDVLIMSQKERERKAVLEQVKEGYISYEAAARRLSISVRQLRRIRKRYRAEGDEGLLHKNQGRASNSGYSNAFKAQVLQSYKADYRGFGPTLAAEKLEEREGLRVNRETLRGWLKAAGLWEGKRKRSAYRKRRARRERFGELLQLDGSIHQWFEGSDQYCCLMNLVDDATGKTLALMDEGETTRAAFSVLKWWIQEAGIPQAIYVDLKSLYVSPKALKGEESGGVEAGWLTHFSKACKRLGIEVIKAYSPQAKGRVERSHAVYQDRLVKELKLRKIKTLEGANALLSGGFINQLNAKFAKPPQSALDGHAPLYDTPLDHILCWEEVRQVNADWTIRYKNRFYQLDREQAIAIKPKQKVKVRTHLDGRLSIVYQEQCLAFDALPCAPDRPAKTRQLCDNSEQRSQRARSSKHKTPWGQYNPEWLKSRAVARRKRVGIRR